jgi:hypothetical protein
MNLLRLFVVGLYLYCDQGDVIVLHPTISPFVGGGKQIANDLACRLFRTILENPLCQIFCDICLKIEEKTERVQESENCKMKITSQRSVAQKENQMEQSTRDCQGGKKYLLI